MHIKACSTILRAVTIGVNRTPKWPDFPGPESFRLSFRSSLVGGNLEPTVSASQLRNQAPASALLVDVRSGTELASGHIPGAVNIPMDQIEARLGDLGESLPIVLICQAGTRARMTADLLRPCGRQITVLEGGTKAWMAAGLPVVASVRTRWSLERQVRLGAGLLVVVGVALALMVNPRWIYLCGFIGLGLCSAGLTDICAMGILVGKMPWNRQAQCAVGGSAAKPVGMRR